MAGQITNLEETLSDMHRATLDLKGEMNDLRGEMQTSTGALIRIVKKELASLLNQRPPASVADIKAVSLEIQHEEKLLADTHQSTLDVRVEMKAEADKQENSFLAYDTKFDSEFAFINQRVDGLHSKMDQAVGDIRNVHMVIPYQQNLQATVQWHAQQTYNRGGQLDDSLNKALESTRMLGEAMEEHHEYFREPLKQIIGNVEELLSRLLPATT
ncbi:unnamed protein product, partial [Symbiodinium sp. CCMP2456]